MCKFANECMTKMNVITASLSMTLGEDTKGLAMRVGLHSGSVTGRRTLVQPAFSLSMTFSEIIVYYFHSNHLCGSWCSSWPKVPVSGRKRRLHICSSFCGACFYCHWLLTPILFNFLPCYRKSCLATPLTLPLEWSQMGLSTASM